MTEIWSAEPWHISGTVGAVTLNRDIDVLGGPAWSKAKLAREAINLGTGTTTLITRQDTSATWTVTLAIVITPDDVAVDRSDLEALFDLIGPWTLTDVEGNQWDIRANPVAGQLSYENAGAYRVLTIPFKVV
jgi:hypothetical protein